MSVKKHKSWKKKKYYTKKPELLNNFELDFLTRDTPLRFFELRRVTQPEEIVKKNVHVCRMY